MIYPLQFTPFFKEFVWGGRKLSVLFSKDLPANTLIGESWEIYNGSIVRNGDLSGFTLHELVKRFGKDLVGSRQRNHSSFPLILKLSTAELDLSVQVHPDDESALLLEPLTEYTGKTEAIYVVGAEEKTRIYYGFNKRIDMEELSSLMVSEQSIVPYLNSIKVQKGDVVLVPPGTVHAYGSGLVYYEVQQNSDITYRIYDWGRLDKNGVSRPLHIEKALKVINYDAVNPRCNQKIRIETEFGEHTYLAACDHFLLEELSLLRDASFTTDGTTFIAVCVIEGQCVLHSPHSELALNVGDSVLVPAELGYYSLHCNKSKLRILRTTIPDVNALIQELRSLDVSDGAIIGLGGNIFERNNLRTKASNPLRTRLTRLF